MLDKAREEVLAAIQAINSHGLTEVEKLRLIVSILELFPGSIRHFLAGRKDEDGPLEFTKVWDEVFRLRMRIDAMADNLEGIKDES